MDVNDSGSEKSLSSRGSAMKSVRSTRTSNKNGGVTPMKSVEEGRLVSKLRPKNPIISQVIDSVSSVCKLLASKRGDASLVTGGAGGGLSGIITDTDITRRVVAKYLDPSSTSIDKVMTANPTCVSMQDSAMDALGLMVENHFRHLPVIDGDSGNIVGVLDIAKCLHDAISCLEKADKRRVIRVQKRH